MSVTVCAEVIRALDFQQTSVKKTTQVESSERDVVDENQVSNTVKNLSQLLSVNAEATVGPENAPTQLGPAVVLQREKRVLDVHDSSESSVDFTNFASCLKDAGMPAPKQKGSKQSKAPKVQAKTAKQKSANKEPGKPKPSSSKKTLGGKGNGKGKGKSAPSSTVPEWRLRALKQRKMQQVDEIELKCTQLIEQFSSNDTVLNLSAEKCEGVQTKLADLLDPASRSCMLPYLKDAEGVFTQEGTQAEVLSLGARPQFRAMFGNVPREVWRFREMFGFTFLFVISHREVCSKRRRSRRRKTKRTPCFL